MLVSSKAAPVDPAARAEVDRVTGWARTWAPDVPVYVVWLAATGWQRLDGADASAPEGPVLGVAGIGAPETFRDTLSQALGSAVDILAFSDHHRYDHQDVERMLGIAGDRTLVVTEKDAVKLSRFPRLHGRTRVLTLGVAKVEGAERLEERLRALVAS